MEAALTEARGASSDRDTAPEKAPLLGGAGPWLLKLLLLPLLGPLGEALECPVS
jgi:hypothetical protein